MTSIRGTQDVRIFGIQDRSSRPEARKPRVARWKVDGKEHSRSFRTKAEADRFRSRLLVAQQDGERFDRPTGLPGSWLPQGADTPVHVWARRWVAEQWPEWQPRTRRGDVYSLARFIPLVTSPGAPEPPAGLRSYLCRTLPPDVEVDPDDRVRALAVPLGAVPRRPEPGDARRRQPTDGPRRQGSATRQRAPCAATAGWPTAASAGRSSWGSSQPTHGRRRPEVAAAARSTARSSAVDVRRLPAPASVVAIIDALRSHQPGSRTYQAMTAVVFYAGLRPSEVVMLRPRALHLPARGVGIDRRHRGRHRLGRARRPQDRQPGGPDPASARRAAANVGRRARPGRRRADVPHPGRRPPFGVQLVEGAQAGVRERRPAPDPGLRLPARGRHDDAQGTCAARRGGSSARDTVSRPSCRPTWGRWKATTSRRTRFSTPCLRGRGIRSFSGPMSTDGEDHRCGLPGESAGLLLASTGVTLRLTGFVPFPGRCWATSALMTSTERPANRD